MAVQLNPIAPALPPATAIQDPAARQFAQSASDVLHALQSSEGAITSLLKALEQVPAATAGGVLQDAGYAQVVSSILKSELYASLRRSLDLIPIPTETRERLEVTEAGLAAETTTRTTNDSALVQAINAAWTVTGATSALIENGEVIETNWNAAQANQWTQLQAEVFGSGGDTIRAALNQEATLRANADGSLYTQWTVKTDLNGYISGFGFASTVNNATPFSQFIVLANRFAVVMPGVAARVPFVVDNGVTYMDTAMIKAASIGTLQVDLASANRLIVGRANIGNAAIGILQVDLATANRLIVGQANIGNASIGTLNIQGNAVTIPVGAYTAGSMSLSTSWITVQSIFVNPEGGTVSLVGSLSIAAEHTNINPVTSVRIYADNGTVVAEAEGTHNTLSAVVSLALSGVSTYAGWYRLQAMTANFAFGSYSKRSLIGIGSKK